MKYSAQPAYPHTPDGCNTSSPIHGGLTKREHFAGLIMQGLLANNSLNYETLRHYAVKAVIGADELLKQLDKEQ